jgi:hypothetical protein
MTHPRISLCMLSLAVAGLVFACETSSSSGSSNCKALQDSLLDCGLLSSGEFQCIEEDCQTQCAAGLACGDLTLIFCGDYTAAPDYVSCYESCSTFTCKNGASISATSECDGYDDCSDGSDEVGCPDEDTGFRCDASAPDGKGGVSSGSTCGAARQKLEGCGFLEPGDSWTTCNPPETPAETCFIQCSMAASCTDLKFMICDTDDPPSQSVMECIEDCQTLPDTAPDDFQCANGQGSVAQESVCDGYEDCSDSSDEISCATLVCI